MLNLDSGTWRAGSLAASFNGQFTKVCLACVRVCVRACMSILRPLYDFSKEELVAYNSNPAGTIATPSFEARKALYTIGKQNLPYFTCDI